MRAAAVPVKKNRGKYVFEGNVNIYYSRSPENEVRTKKWQTLAATG